MAVNTTHPMYDKMAKKWKRCRDVVSGQDAVHDAVTEYLPKLKDQSEEDYKAYVQRTPFFNATWRTVSGLMGMLFRKPPLIEVPASVEPLLDAVTDDGQPFRIFALEVVEECLTTGRAGVMVDYPVANAESITMADAQRLNLRPTLALYKAESILNWKVASINNRRILTQIILAEMSEVEKDEFEVACKKIYRVLDLFNGAYRVRLFQETEDSEEEFEQIGDDMFPTMGGKTLDFIPFCFLGTDDTSVCPDEPPLIDLVDMNLSHYRTSADYEHGCHFTALPTGYIAGHSLEPGEKIYLGSQSMLCFPQPDTKVGFLEFSGSGLGALKENLERKEQQMAVIGARMLEQQKKAAEAAETASLNRAGENSLLASIAQAISMGLGKALQVFSDWAGGSGGVRFELNRDFFPMPMDPTKLTALVTSWQMGAISKETLFENLKQGEVIADARDFEEEEAKIANASPVLSSGVES